MSLFSFQILNHSNTIMQPNIGLEQKVLKKDNELLNAILADLHVLYIKTRKFHWDVSGPSFKEYHEFFEEQYTAMEEEIDQVAERIRQLGGRPVATMIGATAASRSSRSDIIAEPVALNTAGAP